MPPVFNVPKTKDALVNGKSLIPSNTCLHVPALQNPIHSLASVGPAALVPVVDSILDQSDQTSDVVEFSLFQDSLFGQVLVDDQFAVAKVVQDRPEVRGVAVNQIGAGGILEEKIVLTQKPIELG